MATMKQKLVASKIAENGGNMSKTMREVGYIVNPEIKRKKMNLPTL